ncbi:C6 transcription factor [Colletotrichum musicola]|uniref:C6 transcription factor n=1 Tax=Colletotrichum musicola TaxID=2175873 RepID=A0A8H6N995_9PEZI|nr:C6 transcription factor [Colletotrichum musicola]
MVHETDDDESLVDRKHHLHQRLNGSGSGGGGGDDNGAPELRRHSEPNLKRRRITKACDFCHRRGRKCKPADRQSGVAPVVDADGNLSCLTCIEHGADCTWTRVAAKRGVKSKTSPTSAKPSRSVDGGSDRWFYDESRHGSPNLVYRLICIFFDTIYPIFPFYDEDLVTREWETTNMSSNRAAFARLMAICAVSAAHVRDGALFNPNMPETVRDEHQQAYLEEARRAIPDDNRDIREAEVFEYLQTLGSLSLAAIQVKDDALYEQYLARYHNLVAQHKFQFETNWPTNLTAEEVYVRRQFFWSMYRLEVHSALIGGHVIRCPELQCGVAYPMYTRGLAGVLDPTGGAGGGPSPKTRTEVFFPGSWLTGWNYITDLYRMLEHVVVRMRKPRVKAVHTDVVNIDRLLPPIDEILQGVLDRKSKLPSYASHAAPASEDREMNLCGFQVANIACTYQLTRMAAFACENEFEKACSAACELIDEIRMVPVEYLRAIGHPMLQELVGVGHLLSSFIGRQLLPDQLYHFRTVMYIPSRIFAYPHQLASWSKLPFRSHERNRLQMAKFLHNLGPSLPNATQISSKLFQYVTHIEVKMKKTTPAVHIPAMIAPVVMPPPCDIHHHQQQHHHPQQHIPAMENAGPSAHMVPLTQMIPPAPVSAPVAMATQQQQQQYTFNDPGGFYHLPTNFMTNVFSTAFSDNAEVDWSYLETMTPTGDWGWKPDATLS